VEVSTLKHAYRLTSKATTIQRAHIFDNGSISRYSEDESYHVVFIPHLTTPLTIPKKIVRSFESTRPPYLFSLDLILFALDLISLFLD